jgi:excisionase family DNA binding protein
MPGPFPTRQISTREAASLLGCVERTVLLMIGRGEISADQKGHRWRVDLPSVELHPRFRGRSTPAPHAFPTPQSTEQIPSAPEPSSSASPAPDPHRPSLASPAPPTELADLTEGLSPKRPRREWTYRQIEVLRDLSTLAARLTVAVKPAAHEHPEAVAALLESAYEAARQGAAGFHAWADADKTRLYARAREHLAMTASMLWVLADLTRGHTEGLRLLATEYEQRAPALGGLMRRRAEAKGARRRDA